MKRRFLILAGVTSAIAITSLLLSRRLQTSTTGKTVPAGSVVSYQQASKPSSQALVSSNEIVEVSRTNGTAFVPLGQENVVSAKSGSQEQVVRVPGAKTLATVNGAAITLNDLLPLNAAQKPAEQIMSAETYQFLLERAINRELAFQSARKKGIELTPQQQAQREQVRQTLLAQQGDPATVTHLNGIATLEEQIQFEQRDATSQLLLNSLVQKAGVSSPDVTDAQVRQYYEIHRQEYGPLPDREAERGAAWQKIDFEIRQRLAPILQAEYQQKRQSYIEQLRARATIVASPPLS